MQRTSSVREVNPVVDRRSIGLPAKGHLWVLGLVMAALASANLYMGVAIAMRPDQSQDLRQVLEWSREALRGVNPYEGPTSDADYPPHALLIAAPLTLLEARTAVELWVVLQCALAIFVAIAAVRLWPQPSTIDQALVVLCILSWNSVRVGLGNGQLTVLSLWFGLIAAHMKARRVVPIGILVGAACMKPHVGVAFVIWLLLRRRFKEVAIAGVTVCFATILISVRMQHDPIVVVRDFLGVLLRMFGGPVAATEGALELQPLIRYLVPNQLLAMAAHASIFVILTSAIARRAFLRPAVTSAEALLLGCSWTLVFVFHNVYDLILLAPLFAGCAMARIQRIGHRALLSITTLWALVMIVDVPGVAWKLGGRVATASPWMHFDRVLVLGLLLLAVFVTTPSRRVPVIAPWPWVPRVHSDDN